MNKRQNVDKMQSCSSIPLIICVFVHWLNLVQSFMFAFSVKIKHGGSYILCNFLDIVDS